MADVKSVVLVSLEHPRRVTVAVAVGRLWWSNVPRTDTFGSLEWSDNDVTTEFATDAPILTASQAIVREGSVLPSDG
jgi:hypothetical protein